jgi:hypothetical protein
MAAATQKYKAFLCVQDLTCPATSPQTHGAGARRRVIERMPVWDDGLLPRMFSCECLLTRLSPVLLTSYFFEIGSRRCFPAVLKSALGSRVRGNDVEGVLLFSFQNSR